MPAFDYSLPTPIRLPLIPRYNELFAIDTERIYWQSWSNERVKHQLNNWRELIFSSPSLSFQWPPRWMNGRVIMFQEHISYALNDGSILMLLILIPLLPLRLDARFHRHHSYKSPESVALQNCPPFFGLPSFT